MARHAKAYVNKLLKIGSTMKIKKILKKINKPYMKALSILGICIIALGTMFIISIVSVNSSIKKVDKLRGESIEITKSYYKLIPDAGNKLLDIYKNSLDKTRDYEEVSKLYTDVENATNNFIKLDGDFVKNAESQTQSFRPLLQFLLSPSKKQYLAKVQESLEIEKTIAISTAEENKTDNYAYMAITRIMADMTAAYESLAANNISEAIRAAAPLQKYSRDNFSFNNESLIKEKRPSEYDTIQNGKKLFSDTYNYLLAVNAGNYQEANNLWYGLSNRYEILSASLGNALETKNPDKPQSYQSEIDSIAQYIESLDSLKANFNKNREIAYYIIQNLEYFNYKESKYPRVSDFEALKSTLNLKFGSSDIIKYSSSDDLSFSLEYLENGKWIKIERPSSEQPSNNTQSA